MALITLFTLIIVVGLNNFCYLCNHGIFVNFKF